MNIPFGSRVRDKISGFTGILVAQTDWIHGCSRGGIDSEELKDNKLAETVWFDIQRLELVEENAYKFSMPENTKVSKSSKVVSLSGGPQQDPSPKIGK